MQHDEDARPEGRAVHQIPTVDHPTELVYAPSLDGDADPGEVVWSWVPFEEDPQRGKDRPLLVIGRHGTRLRAMMLTSKLPDARHQQDWLELGAGTWDKDGRVSYLRLDRLFELGEHEIRREGAIMAKAQFIEIAEVLAKRYGWR
ncbi:type II toxin-antitoxin system PemK/MazF family toxin [Pseudonocardiaceae bacterium YIM PH 21723]|nr:type II toxin-antitoxin system PemK/MazF family toxin [Pseudonocardiaceae bacterium YIM PH 21723]